MHPPFVNSESRLPGDARREVVVQPQWGRVLVVAMIVVVAAAAAALLIV
jgi:hypothetical protein